MTSRTYPVKRPVQFEYETLPEDFRKLNIHYRICQKFCPKSFVYYFNCLSYCISIYFLLNSDDEDVCVCNQKRGFHKDQTGQKGDKWNISIHTKTILNEQYFGTLYENASYVRLDIETPLATVAKLLLQFWKIPPPTLIMSIIGGAKYFKLNDRLESNVIKGIMNVAAKSNVWMITTGYNAGIVQLIGQAIRKVKSKYPDRKMTAIGIGKWGTPVVTIVVEGGFDTIANIYNDLKNNIPVVIINGSGRVADIFSRWLLRAKHFENDFAQGKVPYEIDELNRISEDTEEILNNEKLIRSKKSKYKNELEEDLQSILSHDDGSNQKKHSKSDTKRNDSDENIKRAVDQIMYCLQPAVRSQITVFNLGSESDLSETIFESICKSFERSSKDDDDEQIKQTPFLKLAMEWNCIHVAKEFVFQNSLDNIPDLEEAFLEALRKDLPLFVYEFLKLGIDPADIFFPSNQFIKGIDRYEKFITKLYNEDELENVETHLKYFIDISGADTGKKIDSVESLNTVLENLIGDYMHKLYFRDEEDEEKDRIKCGLMQNSAQSKKDTIRDTENNKFSSIVQKKQKAKKYIMRDLFLWAVLMNRIDMAKMFLFQLKYRICPALIATKILKKYYSIALYGELKDRYEENIKYFEQYAIDCLDKCDDHDADRACELVIQQNELYGYVTCLQVASGANDERFIAAPACVQGMNNIWYDKLYPEQKSMTNQLALFIGFISLGLMAPSFVKYRENEKDLEVGESPKLKLELHGINYSDPYPLEYPRYFKTKLTLNQYTHHLIHFHSSLLIKFCYHLIFYLFFLLLFSYVLLFNFSPPKAQSPSIHWTEILTIILVSCMLIEETHCFFTQDNLTFWGKLKKFFRDFLKSMTALAFILFYIGLILRFNYADSEEKFIVARAIMAYDIELWWLRCLSFIIVIPYLGPHLVAIGKMLQDLLFFTIIIAIVMIGYGVASRSMVYFPTVNGFAIPAGGSIDNSFDGRSVFRYIAYPVYYLLYGNVGDERMNLDNNPDAGWSISNHVLLAIHMLFVNVLLTNLLIAMFSKRFDEVHEDTINIWYSQQYLFTREYFARSPFIPPISLIYDIYYLIRMFVFFIRRNIFDKSLDREAKVFRMIAKNKALLEEWREFEGASTYEYAHAQIRALKDASKKSSNGSASSTKEKKEDKTKNHNQINEDMENLKEVQDNVSKLSSTLGEMKIRFTTSFT
ncbi:unnamed protein product [Rotaria sp. Silwood2]|nr:unnamed protein product [Rotaria sp. Silwood2]CAF4002259.1 unnamed protein product [Rotaria sp. Silwood2]CAF4059758.1 unnamed protein product [Rotaria sp. Silwood2]